MFSIKKRLFTTIIFSFFVFSLFANSANLANKKTALRYLKLAEQYASQKDWASALSNTNLALAYDDSISDLWYFTSLCQKMTGEKKLKILPNIENALTLSNWVGYNKESARVLYADLLCSTKKFDEALVVLDMEPFIYSSDAEYIRSKCYYNLQTEENLQKARNKIDSARRIYPSDLRFPELFFLYEYKNGGRNNENAEIADSFIQTLTLYDSPNSTLEILATSFAEGEQKTRLLKSFDASEKTSPYYPSIALKENLISEEKALDYFYSFANDSIDFDILKEFALSLQKEESIAEFRDYLNSYNGTIYIDTDKDLSYNLNVSYKRGRPQKISYDENQDDENEWECVCDFGVPLSIKLQNQNILIEYDSWPSISKATYLQDENENEPYKLQFNLISESLFWTPLLIEAQKDILQKYELEFFVPLVNNLQNEISGNDLIYNSSSYSIPSSERKNSLIKVSLLDGKAQIARYFENDILYAQTQFKNGMPDFRNVDYDGDGLFETTETYGFSGEQNQNYISAEEEFQIVANLFGSGSNGTGFYVKMIQIDQNGDTIPDFTEEYTQNMGKISSWDLNNDGKWEIQYKKQPLTNEGELIEQSTFFEPYSNEKVIVTNKNGIPSSVEFKNRTLTVTKDEKFDFYWIGKIGSKEEAENFNKNVNQNTTLGFSIIVQNNQSRIHGVRIGKYIFAKIIDEKEYLEKINEENL